MKAEKILTKRYLNKISNMKNKFYNNAMLLFMPFLAKTWRGLKDFSTDKWFDKIVAFAENYIFGFVGIIFFVGCVTIGFSTMLSGWNPNPEQVSYKNKKFAFYLIIGGAIVLGAAALTIMANALYSG